MICASFLRNNVCKNVSLPRVSLGDLLLNEKQFSNFIRKKYLLKKNCAVEAAKSKCSSKFATRRNPSSKFLRFKRWRLENWAFLHTLFLENEARINKTNYATMLFMSKSVCPKIALDPAKIKIDPKWYIRPFCTKAFNCVLVWELLLIISLPVINKWFISWFVQDFQSILSIFEETVEDYLMSLWEGEDTKLWYHGRAKPPLKCGM